MRYILSGLSLVLALVFFALGIGQRTIWAPPDTITEQLPAAVETPVLVLNGDLLDSHDGRQSITIESDGEITAVVGRLSDVLGWVGDADHTIAGLAEAPAGDEEAIALEVVTGGETTVPELAGSDMWVQEQTGEGSLRFSVDAPYDYAIAIVSDGEAPAPSDVSVAWGYQSTTPWFGPLMTAGFVLLALALVLLLLAVRRHRKHRGPQRRLSPAPSRRERKEIQRQAAASLTEARRPALEEASDADSAAAETPAIEAGEATVEDAGPAAQQDAASDDETPRDEHSDDDTHDDTSGGAAVHDDSTTSADATTGAAADDEPGRESGTARRTARAPRAGWLRGMRLAGPALIAVVALGGCSASDWPAAETPTPTPTGEPEPTSIEDTLPDPAVTVNQFDRILADTRDVVAEADETLDADLAATRLGGAMLESRETAYRVLGEDAEALDVVGIPDGNVSLVLPQQSTTWPRAVVAVVSWADSELTPTALVFQQDTARDDFKVVYQFQLEPGATVTGASADIGAAGLPPDTPLLSTTPESVAAAYASVLLGGDDAEQAGLFLLEDEALNAQIGAAAWAEYAGAEEYDLVDFSRSSDEDDFVPVTIVANDSGAAYVATSFTMTTTARISEDGEGATIGLEGAERILAGVDETETGTSTTYQVQVLFMVPPTTAAEDEQQISVVGFSYDLLDAQEVQ